MDSKTISGYCGVYQENRSVTIKVLDASTKEGTEKVYGTYECDFKKSGMCFLPECSVLQSNGIKVGQSL